MNTDYLLTINNPNIFDIHTIFDIITNDNGFRFRKFIVGFENYAALYNDGELSSGTYHAQIAMRFREPVSFFTVKKMFQRAHIEVCRDFDASYAYCKKEGCYFELEISLG